MYNEEVIIEQIKSGIDVDKGFRILVKMHQEKLYWHIRGIMKSHEETNDVMQNTFIKVFKNISNFKGSSKFYTWLYRIATNESLNQLHKNKRNGTSSLDDNRAIIAKINAEPEFDEIKAQDIFQNALDTLPEKQRLVFNMKYFDEMTYKDISEVLETSVGGLKASFHHAVKKIEAYVKSVSYE